jgi:xylulokinase
MSARSPLFLGIDVGTSATKAVVCTADGRLIAEASAPHDLLTSAGDGSGAWSEQDPQQWWGACVQAVAGCLAAPGVASAAIAAVGLSGQMHGAVLMGRDARADATGQAAPLRSAILWNDQRTGPQCRQLLAALHPHDAAQAAARLLALTGNPVLNGFTLPKWLWVRQHQPDLFARTGTLLLPKDFIRYRLTGTLGTDVGDAAGTLLLDVARRRWSAELLAALGLSADLLPPLSESATLAGVVSPAAARATGLLAGTPVAFGTGDNMAAAVGAGVVRPGRALAVLGTSGVMLVHDSAFRSDTPSGRVLSMCAADGSAGQPGGWCNTGCMLSAGGALTWARSLLAPAQPWESLLAEAASAPPGCDGLLFLPYLTGERCPHPDPLARAGWVGLTIRHTRAHLVRAVIEGVTFGMAQMLDLMRAVGHRPEAVRLSGGGNRTAFWRQLQADLYRLPVQSPLSEAGGSALGGAVCGAVAVGAFASVAAACDSMVPVGEPVLPQPLPAPLAAAQSLYAEAYAPLAPAMHRLSAIEAMPQSESLPCR